MQQKIVRQKCVVHHQLNCFSHRSSHFQGRDLNQTLHKNTVCAKLGHRFWSSRQVGVAQKLYLLALQFNSLVATLPLRQLQLILQSNKSPRHITVPLSLRKHFFKNNFIIPKNFNFLISLAYKNRLVSGRPVIYLEIDFEDQNQQTELIKRVSQRENVGEILKFSPCLISHLFLWTW